MFLFFDFFNRELEMKYDGGKSERINIFFLVFIDMVFLSFIFFFVDLLGCFYCIFVLFCLVYFFLGGLIRKFFCYLVVFFKVI